MCKPRFAGEAGETNTPRCEVADAAAGQSGFIAGFAYYELSRQSAANAERVPWYPILWHGNGQVHKDFGYFG